MHRSTVYTLQSPSAARRACPRLVAGGCTGIAAANVELEGTAVGVSTLHCLFHFDGNYESCLDFSKTTHEKVDKLISLEVLLLDRFR